MAQGSSPFYRTRLSATPSNSSRALRFEEIKLPYNKISPKNGTKKEALPAVRPISFLHFDSKESTLENAHPKMRLTSKIEPVKQEADSPSSLPKIPQENLRRKLILDQSVYYSPKTSTNKSMHRSGQQFSPIDMGPNSNHLHSSANNCRMENSLLVLTKRFMQLQSTTDESGILNLNEAAKLLGVQKRRLYDITNVMEGIDLIEKVGKNSIRWKNKNSDHNSHHLHAKQLLDDLRRLNNAESELDNTIEQMNNALKLTLEDPTDKPYSYVEYTDLRAIPCMDEQTVIAVKAPPGSSLEVPDPKDTGKLQMLIRSENGNELEVFLCPDISKSNGSEKDEEKHREEQAENGQFLDEDVMFNSSLCSPSKPSLFSVSSGFMSIDPVPDPDSYLYGLTHDEGIRDLFGG